MVKRFTAREHKNADGKTTYWRIIRTDKQPEILEKFASLDECKDFVGRDQTIGVQPLIRYTYTLNGGPASEPVISDELALGRYDQDQQSALAIFCVDHPNLYVRDVDSPEVWQEEIVNIVFRWSSDSYPQHARYVTGKIFYKLPQTNLPVDR